MATVLLALTWISLTGYPIFVLVGLYRARHAVRPNARSRCEGVDTRPPVSILKPCAGVDDGLEESLESFFALRYPAYEILFGVSDPADPACDSIRRVIARHSERPARLVITGESAFASPKVWNLASLADHARHTLFWLSDSNTRVHPDTLADLVDLVGRPGVACAASAVVGVGERTWVAALANLHMTAFVGCGTFTAHAFTGLVGTGKSVLISRDRIDEVGGFRALAPFAGEDIVLFQSLRARSWRVALGRHLVADVCERTSLSAFARRHVRWAAIRLRTKPIASAFEPLLSPMIPAAANLASARDMHAAWLLIAAAAVQLVTDGAIVARLRGRVSTLLLATIALRPMLLFLLWLRALFPITIRWRGRAYRMRAGSRIERVGRGGVAEALADEERSRQLA